MCKLGDIIVVKKYKSIDNKEMKNHSFVVINDEAGTVKSLSYTFVASVMSSFKSKKQKTRKLKYKENLEIKNEHVISKNKNRQSGFIKADQLYYFDKENLDFYVLGKIDKNLLNDLLSLIMELEDLNRLKANLNNIKQTSKC